MQQNKREIEEGRIKLSVCRSPGAEPYVRDNYVPASSSLAKAKKVRAFLHPEKGVSFAQPKLHCETFPRLH